MTDQVQNHILNNYQLLKKVGSGAYGHVWKVSDKNNGNIYALKKIFDAFQHSTDAQRTYRQIMFLHQFQHQNIIKLNQVYKAQNDKDLYLVFQFMQADLHNAIGQKILKDIHHRFILYQIIKGIKYLHSASVIHRDLKPSNILINSDCQIKICDFGLARSLVSDQHQKDIVLTQQVATRWYRAPQVLLGSNYYGNSADVWSIGCILAEIINGKPFFPGNSTLSQLQKILAFTGMPNRKDIQSLQSECAQTMIKSANIAPTKNIKDWFKPGTPDDAIDLVVKMLQFNPKSRITIDEVLKHPYISQFRDQKTQTVSSKSIRPPISDNKKLNLKQYRALIYESIDKMFNPSYPALQQKVVQYERRVNNQSSIVKQSSKQKRQIRNSDQYSNSYHFSNTCKNFYTGSPAQKTSQKTAGLFTSSNSTSTKKILTHSYSQNNFYPSSNSLNRSSNSLSKDDSKTKTKSSLKDLLKQRKTPAKSQKEKSYAYTSNSLHYQPSTVSNTNSIGNLLSYKYYKNTSLSQKENRLFYGKA